MKLTLKILEDRIRALSETVDNDRVASRGKDSGLHKKIDDNASTVDKRFVELNKNLEKIGRYLDDSFNNRVKVCRCCGESTAESYAKEYWSTIWVYHNDRINIEKNSSGFYSGSAKERMPICDDCAKLESWEVYKKVIADKKENK